MKQAQLRHHFYSRVSAFEYRLATEQGLWWRLMQVDPNHALN